MIEIKDVEKLADLARIHIDAEEKEKVQKDLNSILGYVEEIQKVVSEENILPSHTTRNILRDDCVIHEPGVDTRTLVDAAPSHEGDYIKVKKVLG